MLEGLKYKLSRDEDSKYLSVWKCKISEEGIEYLIDRTIKEKIQDKIKVDGFRPGKVPADLIKKEYSERALSIGIRDFISELVPKIIADEKYSNKLATSPDIEFKGNPTVGESFSFLVSFFFIPEIPDKFDKISVTLNELKFSKEEEEIELQKSLKRYSNKKLIENEDILTKNGHIIDISFTGKIDDKEIENGSSESYELELGSKSFIDTFEDQLIGKRKGEFVVVKVKFPENYQAKDLAGKNATFDVVINNIYENEIPELTEELAKKMGFTTIQEFKDKTLKNHYEYYEILEKRLKKDEIYKKFIDKFNIKISPKLIEKEALNRLEYKKEQIKKSQDPKQIKEFDEKKYLKRITEDVGLLTTSFYINREVANKNSLNPSEAEIEEHLARTANKENLNPIDLKKRFDEDENFAAHILSIIMEHKAYNFIFDKINKTTKKLSKKEFESYIDNAIKENIKKQQDY